MKINVGDRKIIKSDAPDLSDIPLGYIDNADTVNSVDFIISTDFLITSSKQITPYQKITNPKALFFNSSNKIIKNIELKRQGNSWIYEPKTFTEFTPARFECYATIKKSFSYSEEKSYNLKVCVAEQNKKMSLCNTLSGIFGNANKRGICPSNIIINENKTEPESLLEESIGSSDFVFIESSDGITLPDGLSLSDILSQHTNIWISAKSFDGFQNATSDDTSEYTPLYSEGRLNAFFKNSSRKAIPTKIIKKDTIPEDYDDYDQTVLYDDILLLSKANKGFIIISPSEFFDKIIDNSKILYDVMMYVYLKCYIKSKRVTSWITDAPVSTKAYSFASLNRYHEQISLKNMLDASIKNEDYSIMEVFTDTDNVFLADITSDKEFFFRKSSGATKDPTKKASETSFLTTKQTVIYYENEDVYYSETPVTLNYSIKDNDVYVTLEPMVSSSNQINILETATLLVPDMNKKYYLCASQVEAEQVSDVTLVEQSQYSLAKNGIKLAEVIPHITTNTRIYDIRIKGGGLPESYDDDYDMLDIGNLYGRPYRVGSTLIFRLPPELEQYKDKIETAVDQHIIAGDIPIFTYTYNKEDNS